MRTPIHRALVSVFDKTGVGDLAKFLHSQNVEIISTGSTATFLRNSGVTVRDIAEVTGFPEILGGRVKTLHPHIHGGILADRRRKEHNDVLTKYGIGPIDLVVSNFYPFKETVTRTDDHDAIIEEIDIGGPTLTRAAAKNFQSVAILCDPSDYTDAIVQISKGGFTLSQRRSLATKAFTTIAHYDITIAQWFNQNENVDFPPWWSLSGNLLNTLRYGENPHQKAALYGHKDYSLAGAAVLSGKAMSYNNYVDTNAAWRAVYDFDEPAVAIIKHANPCGIATAHDIASAYRNAHACDSLSAFGGVIAANRTVSTQMAQQIKDVFTEVLAAPAFEDEALKILSAKKNLRLVQISHTEIEKVEVRQISGGFLVQDSDLFTASGDHTTSWQLMSGEPADDITLADLAFAWKVVRCVKSNAIVLANKHATVGIGMGQVNRVDSAQLAVNRAGNRAAGSVAASDAYFPFADGLEILVKAKIRSVVQPGGSVRDDEIIAAAKKAGLTMYFTGVRHFAH